MSNLDDFGFSAPPTSEELASYDFNDYGNALRLIRVAGGGELDVDGLPDTRHVTLLYQFGLGWVAFNGRYWDRQFGEQWARKLTHKVAVLMQSAKDDLVVKSGQPDGRVQQFCDHCGSSGASAAMLKQAEAYLTVPIDVFDRNPMVLNCRNGTVWLKHSSEGVTAELRPHNPADRITRYIDVDFDPGASATLFEKTACEALGDDMEKLDFFQRAMGYSVTGYTEEQAMFLCQGLGRDGKSTLLNAVRQTLGGYGGVGDVKTFLDIGQQGASSASPDLAKLSGDIRLVVLSEPPRDARLNESLIKNWTGGDPIQARELREKPFEFTAIGKLWLQCNAFPVAKGNDDGIWRRIMPILFENQVAPDKVDKTLPERLKGEQAGILNWLIAGVGHWVTMGLSPPTCVTQARDDYRAQSSPFSDWLNERCIHGKAAKTLSTPMKALYDNYKEWAEAQGMEKPMSLTSFGRALAERQMKKLKKQGNIWRTGIRLKTNPELAAEGNLVTGGLAFGAPAAQEGGEPSGAFDPFDGGRPEW